MAVLCSALACARPGPPPGGPEDRDPPLLVAAEPESLAAGVPAGAPVRMTFSERIDRRSLERALWVVPPLLIENLSVSGLIAEVRPRGGWPDSTTVHILLTTALRDRRGIPLAAPVLWTFTTRDSIPTGRVEGRVEVVGGAAERGVALIGLFETTADTLPDPRSAPPVALAQADAQGRYRLESLPTDGVLRVLHAMLDRDGDREIVGRGEFVSAPAESVRLTSAEPRRTIDVRLVDPEAPGDLQGMLARAEGDSTAVWVEALPVEGDSLAEAAGSTQCAADGGFRLRRVPPGAYRLIAWCDRNANGRRDADEPWTQVLDGAVAAPGGTMELGALPGPDCREEAP